MNEREKKINAMMAELADMYEALYGQKYIEGLQENQKSQFNTIIDAFKERIFVIKKTQEERTKKQEKRNYLQSPEAIRINSEIRQDIKKAEQILEEAVRRLKNDTKAKVETISKKILQNRQKAIVSCYQLLKDVRQAEEGGIYKPPPSYPTLTEIKKKLFRKDEVEEEDINYEEEEAIDKMKKNDLEQDGMIDEIIGVNKVVRNKMIEANKTIDETTAKIKQNTEKADFVLLKIKKADNDLAEVLKNYRRPNKLCLDITLILLVLALVGVIINMLKNSSSS